MHAGVRLLCNTYRKGVLFDSGNIGGMYLSSLDNALIILMGELMMTYIYVLTMSYYEYLIIIIILLPS